MSDDSDDDAAETTYDSGPWLIEVLGRLVVFALYGVWMLVVNPFAWFLAFMLWIGVCGGYPGLRSTPPQFNW
ncbi:MAG: hypothetical protein KC912_23535 [Proteobacteria bacterium]|nr:hypothetical protein [Pseudomonadota bacterium]